MVTSPRLPPVRAALGEEDTRVGQKAEGHQAPSQAGKRELSDNRRNELVGVTGSPGHSQGRSWAKDSDRERVEGRDTPQDTGPPAEALPLAAVGPALGRIEGKWR